MSETKLSRSEKESLYAKLVALHPHAELKGDTIPYTSLNGHMYSFLSKDDEVTLKLPEPEKTKFIDLYKTRLAVNYGVVQKDYVVVPDALLRKPDELAPYFVMSYDYVSTLKPKPTSKSKKKD
jgi:hypothetical protein